MGEEIIRIINLVFSGITCLSVIIGIVSIFQKNKVEIRNNRVKKFLARRRGVSVGRASSTIKYFNKYKEEYKDDICDSHALIINKKWQTQAPFMDLDDVEVNIVEVSRKVQTPILKVFPMYSKKWPYTANILKYQNDDANNKQYLFNGDLYALESGHNETLVNGTTINNKYVMNVYKTNYFSFVNTCLVLELEAETNKEYYRNKIDLFDLTNRYAGIGLSTLTVFKNVLDDDGNKKSYFLLHQRNRNLSEGQGMIHVIPAGSFQPIHSIGNDKEAINFDKKLKNTVYREFCEEIFHVDKMAELGSMRLLTNSAEYQFLNLLGVNKFIGMGIEPYNTKVEVLTALYLDMSEESINNLLKEAKKTNNTKLIKYINTNLNNMPFTYQMLENFVKIKDDSGAGEIYNEGKILIVEYNPENIEQYYSQTNVTQALKEIFVKLLLNDKEFE